MFKNLGTSLPVASQYVNGDMASAMGRTGGTGRCATSHGRWGGEG